MAKWILKAVIQKGISFLPYGYKVNYLFQKYVTRGVRLTNDLMDDKLGHCRDHIHYFRKYHASKENYSSLEIGAGWYPIVPIGLFLAGAGQVITVDITPLLRKENLLATLRHFKEYHQKGKLQNFIIDPIKERLDTLLGLADKAVQMPLEEILQTLHIQYLVQDARKLDLSDASIDLITSNNTFEHIYPQILADILREFKRVSKPDNIMSHFIDMSDHFAHMDRSVNIYHFLKYSDATWNMIDNHIQPQNRLRLPDYRKMYEQAGLRILEEVNRPGSVAELETVKLAPRFDAMSRTEVAVSHSLIVSAL